MCYKSFGAFESLQKHMLVHGSDDAKPLQCEICLKRFLNNSALSCHVKIHSGEKKVFECPICKQVYEHVTTLKDHIHVHCVNGVFTCPSCLKKFKEYTQVRKHIRAFHSDKEFPCNQCDKVFPRPDKLKLHLLRHSDHREFLCSDCGKQFKRKDKLKEHTKRMHSGERPVNQKNTTKATKPSSSKKFIPKVSPTDYHRFIYKCHQCLLGFKRRGMLVNHLAKCHPDVSPTSVPELNLPILKTTRDYYCQYCNKVYKSSSKRKSHIVKNHPGADLPMSNRRKGGIPEIPGLPNPTYSQTVGSVTTFPHYCDWCYKQYASKAKLLQHQRKKHDDMIAVSCVTKQLPESMVQVNSPIHSSILINASAITGQQDQTPIGNPPTGQSRQSELVLTTKKGKVSLLSSTAVPTGISVPRLQYVDKHSNIVTHISATDAAQSDLLTQAMSELTQSISAAAVVGDVSADSEYLHLVPSTVSVANTDVMVASPSIDVSTPVPVTTLSHDSTLSPQSTLEQSMLVHLLTRPYDQPASINVQNASTGTQTPHIMNDDSESPDANISRIIDDTEYVPTEHEDLTQSEPTLAMTATSNPSTPLVIQEDQAVLTAADINSNIPIKEESHDISDVEQEMSNCDTWSSANYNEYPAQ
ncbi:PRDM10 (predicted) [Pycnogonum litorale]